MSLLDSLQNDVDAIEAKEQEAAASQAERQRIYDELVQPSINKGLNWFRKFFAQVEVLERENPLAMELPGVGNLPKLHPEEFFFRVGDERGSDNFVCGRRVSGPPIKFSIPSTTRAEAMVQYLDSVGLPYDKRAVFDQFDQAVGLAFELTLNFSQTVRIQGDPNSLSIDLMVTNFHHFGTEHLKLAHNQLDQDLLDRTGLYILGREPGIQHSTMADHLREELQRKVAEHNLQRQQELEAALRERKEEAEAEERERNKLQKLSKLLRRS